MYKYLLLILLILNTVMDSVGQNLDWIYLSNGSMVRGQIIESKAYDYIIIKTKNGALVRVSKYELYKTVSKPAYERFMRNVFIPSQSMVTFELKPRKKITGVIIQDFADSCIIVKNDENDSLAIPYESIVQMNIARLPRGMKPAEIFDNDIAIFEDGTAIYGKILSQTRNDSVVFRMNTADTLILKNNDFVLKNHGNLISGDFHKKQYKYMAIGFGTGPSYGVFGLRFQQRFGDILGFAWHLGAGLSFIEDLNAAVYLNAGVKFYYYRFFYVDASIGSFGPNFLIGADLISTKAVGFNFAFGYESYDDGIKDTFINEDLGNIAIELGLFFRIN